MIFFKFYVIIKYRKISVKGGAGMQEFYPVIVALVFNLFDLVSGVVSAVKNKNLQSAKLRDGLFKKVGFIMCYFLAYIVDNYGTLIGFNLTVKIMPVIIFYVCSTEAVSVIENICKINSDLIPQKLINLFNLDKEN